MSKNLQGIGRASSDNYCKSSKNRVSDHLTFASIFNRNKTSSCCNYQNVPQLDVKNMEKVVQPSIVVPPMEMDFSNGLAFGEFRVGDVGSLDHLMGWVDSSNMLFACDDDDGSEGSRSKRFKVSSSVLVPPTFTGSSPYDCGCESPYNGFSSPYHYGSQYNGGR